MNSIKYINNTIFSINTSLKDKKNNYTKIDITPLKEIIPEYYKYLSLKRLIEIYEGRDYKDKNLEIECRMKYYKLKKYIKIRLNTGIIYYKGKYYIEKYYNIYLPCEINKFNPSLYHKINDIIFSINKQIDNFKCKKELGFQLCVDNIQTMEKHTFWIFQDGDVQLGTAIKTFAKQERKKRKKQIQELTEKQEKTPEIEKSTPSISLENNSTIESAVESIDSTIEGIDNVYEIVNELDGLIKNIHQTLNKYE